MNYNLHSKILIHREFMLKGLNIFKIYLFYKVNYFIIFIKFLYIQQRNCHKSFFYACILKTVLKIS